MKKLLLITLILFSIGSLQTAEAAKIPVVYGNGLTLSTLHQLPDSCIINNKHVNLGVTYEQFSLFWMPIWNYGEAKYALINDAEDMYWDVEDEETLENLSSEYDLKLSKEASIPFWTQVGGKPIILILLALIIYGMIPDKKEEEVATEEEGE